MMERAELTEFRKSRGLNQAQFGAWLAAEMDKERAYTGSEVSNWETGQRDIPWAVAAIIWRAQRDEQRRA